VVADDPFAPGAANEPAEDVNFNAEVSVFHDSVSHVGVVCNLHCCCLVCGNFCYIGLHK